MPAARACAASLGLARFAWHLGHTRIMLATRSPSMRCTSQPVPMAFSARGNRRSQCQQRPLPVEQMACNAACTSRLIRFGVLTAKPNPVPPRLRATRTYDLSAPRLPKNLLPSPRAIKQQSWRHDTPNQKTALQGHNSVAGGRRPRNTRQTRPTLKGSHGSSRPQISFVILNSVSLQQRDELLFEGLLLVPFFLAVNVTPQSFHP